MFAVSRVAAVQQLARMVTQLTQYSTSDDLDNPVEVKPLFLNNGRRFNFVPDQFVIDIRTKNIKHGALVVFKGTMSANVFLNVTQPDGSKQDLRTPSECGINGGAARCEVLLARKGGRIELDRDGFVLKFVIYPK